MKKRWLIAAVALILAGLAVCAVSMAVLGFDFKALSSVQYETKTYPVNEKFDSISITTQTDRIRVLPSDDRKCRVVCSEMKDISHRVEVREGTLSILTEDQRGWIDQAGLNIGKPSMTVYLPGTEYGILSIETDTGDIEIPADFSFGSLQVQGDTADVICLANVSETLKIKLSTGDIHLDKIRTGMLDLWVSTGEISAESVTCRGDAAIRVTTGKVRLCDMSCANFRSEGSTGDITMKTVLASGTMTIERSTGDVKFEESDAAEIFVKTDTGEVKGTLCSEKVFITRSDTGRQDVPKTVIGGRCEITTDTGDIEIKIV